MTARRGDRRHAGGLGMAAAALLSSLALGGAAAAGEAGGTASPIAHPLVGTAWQTAGFADGEEEAAGAGSSTLVFASPRRVEGSAGCNRYGAAVTLADDRLTLGPLQVTERACGIEAMTHERRFLAGLAAARGYVATEGTLRLLDADGRLLVRLRRLGAPR